MKKLLLLAALAALAAFALTACTQNNGGSNQGSGSAIVQGDPLASMSAILEHFPETRDTGEAHVPGTTFMQAIVSPHPIPGSIGGAIFHEATVDNIIGTLLGTTNSVLSMTEFYTFGQDGIATWEMDLGNNTFTITQQHDVYWHDGTPLTLADLVFTYHVIADPAYTGVRFSTYERAIVGIMDYHNGTADYISGLVLSDNDRTLTIRFESLSPSMAYFGFWTTPMPKHIFENIPVADMPNSPYVLVNPVGWGPFMIENVVPGESFYMTRNENYVWGTPYIERLVVERIESSLVPAAMETGRFDYVTFPTLYYADHMNPTNFTYLGVPRQHYGYIAFRLGHWDAENNINIFDPNRYMNNVYLRRAMAMAVNEDEIGELLFNGLHFAAGSFIPMHHPALMDLSLPGFPYDPAQANQILDDAGFTRGEDGYRTWPNGDDLTVIWAHPQDPATEHIIVQLYRQGWSAIGVRVELWQGRTHDQNFLWDTLDVDGDNDEIHIYSGAWTPGANPNPSGSWGHAFWNPSRYTSPEWDAILESLSDPAAFDMDVMRERYFALQAHLQEVVPYFPTRWQIELVALNNRVVNWDARVGVPPQEWGMHMVKLSAAEPYGR